jgi:hypothetical protein
MAAAAPAPAGKPARMLAAIAQLPSVTWTIKSMGSPESIAKIEPQWNEFLSSLKFEEQAKPTFTLPPDWRDTGQSSQFRDVILAIESVSPPLEVVFTAMPADFDLVANVNRWRNQQLGLQPITAAELPGQLAERRAGEVPILVFDATGTANQPPGGGMSMAGGGRGSVPAASDSTPPAAVSGASESSELPFDFTPPENWTASPPNAIVLGKFTKSQGDDVVELSILSLKADSPWEQNVEIWASSLGLESPTPQQIAQWTQTIQLGGRQAKTIEFKSPDGQLCTRIASVVVDSTNWIVKLSGSSRLVAAEQTAWESFLQSIRFR